MGSLFAKEPIVAVITGATAIWFAVPPVLAAFGHPLTDAQVHALAVLMATIAALVGRSQVTANATVASNQAVAQAAQKGTP